MKPGILVNLCLILHGAWSPAWVMVNLCLRPGMVHGHSLVKYRYLDKVFLLITAPKSNPFKQALQKGC